MKTFVVCYDNSVLLCLGKRIVPNKVRPICITLLIVINPSNSILFDAKLECG